MNSNSKGSLFKTYLCRLHLRKDYTPEKNSCAKSVDVRKHVHIFVKRINNISRIIIDHTTQTIAAVWAHFQFSEMMWTQQNLEVWTNIQPWQWTIMCLHNCCAEETNYFKMTSSSPAHQKPEEMPRTFRFEHELETQGSVKRTAAPCQYTFCTHSGNTYDILSQS